MPFSVTKILVLPQCCQLSDFSEPLSDFFSKEMVSDKSSDFSDKPDLVSETRRYCRTSLAFPAHTRTSLCVCSVQRTAKSSTAFS